MGFRPVYSAGSSLEVSRIRTNDTEVNIWLGSDAGIYETRVKIESGERPILRYTTALKPEKDLLFPFWPRDILAIAKNGNVENTTGQIHASQWSTRSGFIYMSMTRPKSHLCYTCKT